MGQLVCLIAEPQGNQLLIPGEVLEIGGQSRGTAHAEGVFDAVFNGAEQESRPELDIAPRPALDNGGHQRRDGDDDDQDRRYTGGGVFDQWMAKRDHVASQALDRRMAVRIIPTME